MNVTHLKLNNLRAMQTAEFRFRPGINLIVGVNGVGKTSVLDALRVCLAAVVNHANGRRGRPESFAVEDIHVGAAMLTVNCRVRLGEGEYSYVVHKPRESSVPRKKMVGEPRKDVYDTPEKAEFRRRATSTWRRKGRRRPSARRALLDEQGLALRARSGEGRCGRRDFRRLRRCLRRSGAATRGVRRVDESAGNPALRTTRGCSRARGLSGGRGALPAGLLQPAAGR